MVSFPQIFFLQFSKMLFIMIEYRVKEFCNFYEIERKSVVRGVEYWLPVDIYGGLFVVSKHSGIYGIKCGIKWYYF